MNQKDKYIFDLESQIQYFKKLLDENGISYDYEAHLRALQSDVGDIVFPELGPEHAQKLYDMLQGSADHVLLLQGGKSLKERATIRGEMAAVRADESIILVAIGQYVGEGFNYPRLDTMLLAMPISFEGNVEQHAGRLNRDYEGKKDAIIFDYIDQHVLHIRFGSRRSRGIGMASMTCVSITSCFLKFLFRRHRLAP